MKIVLDANIYVSAFFWGGNPMVILEQVAKNKDTLFISNEIMAEINNVFGKPKFKQAAEEIKCKVDYIEEIGTRITVSERVTTGGCRDKTDNKYLECAIAANADYVISGDKHLLELEEYCGIKIVNAAEYLQIAGGGESR